MSFSKYCALVESFLKKQQMEIEFFSYRSHYKPIKWILIISINLDYRIIVKYYLDHVKEASGFGDLGTRLHTKANTLI